MDDQEKSPDATRWERGLLEKVALAAVREQRCARRWKIFFRFTSLLLFVVIAWRLIAASGEKLLMSNRHTALVTLEGEIASNSQASADNISSALDTAFANVNAVGVILKINSPGGSPVQANMMNSEIRRLRHRYLNKPLYVVVDDICTSGGYYVAAAADKIFVDPASIVGSIGVRMDSFGFPGLMSKLGIERRLLTAGKNKGFYDPFLPEVARQKEYAQKMLDQVHQQFIQAVMQGRGNRLKKTPDIFSGLFWTGQQSVELGLADGFGDAHYVARELLKAKDIVDYTVKENMTDRLARKFGLAFGSVVLHALGGLPMMAFLN